MMAAVLTLLDIIIGLASAGACVSALLVVIGPATSTRDTPQRARDRRRWFRQRLEQGRRLYEDTPEDRQLARLIQARNLRVSRRERVFLSARVTLADDPSGLDCTILDISDTGARLAFGHAVSLPREIELEIRQKGRRVRAEVVWSHDNTCGIRFIGDLKKDQPRAPEKLTPARRVA
jgi:hypothetical protein